MENAIQKLLKERYYLENESTWEDIAGRVSLIYPPIFEYIKNKLFIPSTPTLQNANTGGERAGTLSSCFTMGIKDSIEDIFDADKEAGLVTKAGGGVGYCFSSLRSSKEKIKSLNAYSSGPVPFIRKINASLDAIRQGGKRLGAGMAQLDINHPDILDFIRAKKKIGECERFNFSVRVTKDFYDELEDFPDNFHKVRFKDGSLHTLYDNTRPVTVKQLWDEIVYHAHDNAEPGIINISIAEVQCTVKEEGDQVLTNPCSEYVNIEYSSCNLGSINLSKLIKDSKFNWDLFEKLARESTRFLNAVIDINQYPIPKIRETTLNIRPIGLGAMGWAHCLFKLGIPFNSKEADIFANEVYAKLTYFSMSESINIAKETGQIYPRFNYNKYIKANDRFFNRQDEFKFLFQGLLVDLEKYNIANSCNTSIAPNGSIAYIANTTGGCEPLFALAFTRKIEKQNKEYEIVHIIDPIFEEYLYSHYSEYEAKKILEYVSANNGSCQGCDLIPEKDQKIFIIASDLTPMEHLHSLGIVARNTSLSVSKTINMPSMATKEDVAEVYIKAQELGIIGVTVYRAGSREGILETEKKEEPKRELILTSGTLDVIKIGLKRPRILDGKTFQIPEGDENAYVTINHTEADGIKRPWEIFINKSGTNSEWYAAIGRLASRLMRKTGDVQAVIDELRHIGGDNGYFDSGLGMFIKSKPAHIGLILEEYTNQLNNTDPKAKKETNDPCPKCKEKLVRQGGCISCPSCGYDKCGS